MPKFVDLTGANFGRLTVVERTQSRASGGLAESALNGLGWYSWTQLEKHFGKKASAVFEDTTYAKRLLKSKKAHARRKKLEASADKYLKSLAKDFPKKSGRKSNG